MKKNSLKQILMTVAVAVAITSQARATIVAGTYTTTSDLDLTGNFILAKNEGGTAMTVGGLNFSDGTVTNGNNSSFDFPSQSSSDPGSISPLFGDLWILSSSLTFATHSATAAIPILNPGDTYKVQLLFKLNYSPSTVQVVPYDITVEGQTLSAFQQANDAGPGQVVTATFVAGDNTLNISMVSTGSQYTSGAVTYYDQVQLNGFTVEDLTVPEPSSVALLGLGGLLVWRRVRGNKRQ